MKEPIPGYARCGVVFVGGPIRLEVEDEEERVSVLIAETDDGPVHIGLNREDAFRLLETLRLFLEDRPRGQLSS